MLRKAFTIPLVVLAACLVALLIAEAFVRLTGLASTPVAVSVDQRTFESIPGVFFPTPPRTDRRNANLPHLVRVNELGFRGPSIPLTKNEGERRVLFLGDSFTWGDFVDDDATLPAQFERLMAGSCPGMRSLNFGVGGTSIDAHAALFDRALRLTPDLVVLVFHDNDVRGLETPTYWTEMQENRRRKSAFPASIAYSLLRRTAVWSVARTALARATAAQPAPRLREVDPTAGRVADTSNAAVDALREEYRERFRTFVSRVQGAGLPLVVTAFPSHLALRDESSTDYGWFAAMVAQEGIDLVDPLERLRNSGLGESVLYLFPHDAHASPRAYAVLAASLRDQVMQSALRARLCPGAPSAM